MGERSAERKPFPELAREFDARERQKTAAALRGHATRKRKRAERAAAIHEAERRVIESAKGWAAAAYKSTDKIREAVLDLEEAERG